MTEYFEANVKSYNNADNCSDESDDDEHIYSEPHGLVDMRRSAIGAEHHPSSPPSDYITSPLNLNLSLNNSGFTSPPILPAKPNSGSPHGKPLPPRPSSTSSSMLSMSSHMKPFPQQPYANTKANSAGGNASNSNNNNNGHPNNNGTPPSSFSINFNQRSVPNLPQLLQQKRLFLSPQPNQSQNQPQQSFSLSQTNLGNSNSNLLNATNGVPNNNNNSSNIGNKLVSSNSSSSNNINKVSSVSNGMPYYSELNTTTAKNSLGINSVNSNNNNNNSSNTNGVSSVPPVISPTPIQQQQQIQQQLQHQQHLLQLHHQVQSQYQQANKPRVRVEWKSVDNLQQQHNYNPRISTNIDIDIGENQYYSNSNSSNTTTTTTSSLNSNSNGLSQNSINNSLSNGPLSKLSLNGKNGVTSSSEKNVSFDSNKNSNSNNINKSDLSLDSTGTENRPTTTTSLSNLNLTPIQIPMSSILPNSRNNNINNNNNNRNSSGSASASKIKSDDYCQPLNSPEYDRIKSPVKDFSGSSGNNKNNASGVKDTQHGELANGSVRVHMSDDVHTNGSGSAVHNNSTSNSGGGESVTKTSVTTPASLTITAKPNSVKISSTAAIKSGAESTDCSSLGRSSTSDGDFGTMAMTGSLNTVNAGSTPSNNREERKSRHSGASSKLKSRRRNILQLKFDSRIEPNLSMDEMRLLNNHQRGNINTNNCNSNTNTGGSSSSDGSSGHASMSDSQTSGSPPAPAGEYARITGIASGIGIGGGNLSHNYKYFTGPSLDTIIDADQSPEAPASGQKVISSSKGKGAFRVLKSVPEDDVNLSSSTRFDSKGDGNRSSGSKKGSSRSRHRNKESILLGSGAGNSNNSGLEDIKQAIEQLTLRSYHGNGGRDGHSSYSTSTYSSVSGSECDRHRRPHIIRHSSLETINTQVTSADEFVWVDSHNRLVELQNFPWTNHEILKVIEKSSRLRDNLERISMETVPRMSYLLQRALVRIARETQRLSRTYGFCTKQEVTSAFRIVLAPVLADSCIKACLRASAMFSVHDPLHRESKSSRAGLHLHVGKFQRWMCEVRLGRFCHEFAAIHLAAGMEDLIEEILGQALSFITTNVTAGENNNHPVLTAALLEQAIANNGDLWGLLQPYAHLNAGRTQNGALAIPRWASIASVDSSGSSSTTIGISQDDHSSLRHQHNKSLEQSLLTTCVGSIAELSEILSRVSHYHHTSSNGSGSGSCTSNKAISPSWSPSAVHTLFYFMRCSQLETADEHVNLASSTATLGGAETVQRQHHQQNVPVQELVYERPFIVLPPLIEWVRVATAHADHRHSGLIDKDDVMQAGRLLLPGIDCPVRLIGSDEFSWPRRPIDEFECNRRLKTDLAFKMLTSGRSDLVAQALLLMPLSKANTFNETGLSPLIINSIRGEENMVKVLLDAGADADVETPPPNGTNFPHGNSETQHWTALTFASLLGHINIVKILLEHGANVEGGAKFSEEKSTQTPLQVASATGNLEIVTTLLNYGANPFISTISRDSLCYTGSAQRGSFSAISVAASHGQRTVLHKLLSHPFNATPSSKEVLSLEEILAEGVQQHPAARNPIHQNSAPTSRPTEEPKILTKSQVKVLQEAMYQSAENGHLEITLDLRNLGVPWTLHCWVNALGTAHDLRCEPVVDQLLQDFLQILPNEDFSQGSFVEECLPLLFAIFRNSKNEGTTLLLADIFQTCYGRDPIKEIRDTTLLGSTGTRIDPKYVNNPELSDVQFRVEGRVFYAHKIVLVTSSPRFKSMLKSAAPDSNPPILQINDIRYHIFQMAMEYLYHGTCDSIRKIEAEDVLELMAAANFFALDGLLRFCEAKCSHLVNIESVVSLYIHAKVYNAVQLLEYCQGFLLQNMVALLSYDDSVRRLIFGKKLHNHDVLAGLLLTLQARLARTNRKSNK